MKIKLNDTTSIDLPKLIETRLLIQANSGGGKSYAIRRLIEQSFNKVQIIVLDPEGEFTNLRSKFDFVYAGKGGDAPVESRSAALLAHRLLELKASAIIDLYELPPHERRHFVRLFCEAMVNAPKELWHEALIIIDEAHVFAPEKGESEALGPVIDLATRGRKRGYCVVLATQRLPKLNKDAAAECNNKLIGRASQDIDRKRASEELGFTTKEQILSLRDLEPGEFYAFGPAISRDVVRITVGDVSVKPPARGTARSLRTPPPSATVKKILGKLKDLPQEAAKEARTVAELKQENSKLKSENTRLLHDKKPLAEPDTQAIAREVERREKQLIGLFDKELKPLHSIIEKIYNLATEARNLRMNPMFVAQSFHITADLIKPGKVIRGMDMGAKDGERTIVTGVQHHDGTVTITDIDTEGGLAKGEKLVLQAIAQHPEGMTREHITVVTGYKTSTRNAYIQRLLQKEYVYIENDKIVAMQAGIAALGSDYKPLPTGRDLLNHYIATLPEGESRVISAIVMAREYWKQGLTRDEISGETGYKTSTRNAYIQRLGTRKLIEERGSVIHLSDHLL